MDPLPVVPCDSSPWNDTVDMRMEQHVLSPRVQDAEEADVGAKMFRVSSDLHKRLGHSMEQQAVEFGLVLEDERVQFMRQREHDMEVRDRQKFPLSGGDPTLTRLSLAFWAVAISARIIGDGPVAATLRTGIDVTAESRCPATHNSDHHLQLLETDSVSMTINIVVAMRTKNIGHLDSRPVHRFCFLFLDRFTVSSLETEMAPRDW
jgi:hypothetical protein